MSSPLLKLPLDARLALAEALESGRLAPPFSSFSLRRYLGSALSAGIAAELTRLGEAGFSAAQLAITMRLLAEEAAEEASAARRVELVWSGPEETGTASRDTGVVLREMFARAERTVVVAGFAVYQGKQVFQVLADRMAARPGLDVRMYLNIQRKYRDTTAADAIVEAFFTEAAQARNIEAGVLIEDGVFAEMLRLQFDGLVASRRLVRVPGL